MHRVVIDSNVLISARLSPRGARPAGLLAAWLDGRFELIASPALLAELAGVLQRPKFSRWLTADEARAFVQTARTSATIIEDPPPQQHSVRDPDDYYLLTLARTAKADYLISGDGDLTSLDNPRPPVLIAADFLATLENDWLV